MSATIPSHSYHSWRCRERETLTVPLILLLLRRHEWQQRPYFRVYTFTYSDHLKRTRKAYIIIISLCSISCDKDGVNVFHKKRLVTHSYSFLWVYQIVWYLLNDVKAELNLYTWTRRVIIIVWFQKEGLHREASTNYMTACSVLSAYKKS